MHKIYITKYKTFAVVRFKCKNRH